MRLVECVPNFSEGRRVNVIASIRQSVTDVPGVFLLDLHQDAVHNRSVLTLAGRPSSIVEAAFRAVARAAELIDLRQHHGEHPRIGATDVVPFVPLGSTTMEECVALAHALGERIGSELSIPVYLYAEAASRPERRWLPAVRAGEYEGLARAIGEDPSRRPDYGPLRLGPAGATAVGARPVLVAYNVNLATGDLALAAEIARAVRESSGGLAAVQARAMRTDEPGVVQVSMNLLDVSVTPAQVVFAAVRQLAEARGVPVLGAELVGLGPLSMAGSAASSALGLRELGPDQIIESRLLEAILNTTDS